MELHSATEQHLQPFMWTFFMSYLKIFLLWDEVIKLFLCLSYRYTPVIEKNSAIHRFFFNDKSHRLIIQINGFYDDILQASIIIWSYLLVHNLTIVLVRPSHRSRFLSPMALLYFHASIFIGTHSKACTKCLSGPSSFHLPWWFSESRIFRITACL